MCYYYFLYFFPSCVKCQRAKNRSEQVGQLSQPNGAAACVSFGKNISDRFFFRFVTIHAFDGQTDGETDRRTPFS